MGVFSADSFSLSIVPPIHPRQLSGIQTEVQNASEPSSSSPGNVNVSSLQADSRPLLLITDPDHIEKSNLNRQFLFHAKHIGLSKSAVAAEAARQMNSAMRITSMEEKVWPANEKTLFTDEFLLNLLSPEGHKSTDSPAPSGIVLAALDCVPSRRYLDTRCVSLHLPLLESGTLGTKGHVQVILPGLTESYNSQRDDDGGPDGPESIPYCTLKSFPTLSIHCVEWAREKFASQFTLKPERLSQLLTVLDRNRPGRQLSVLCASLLRIPTANSDQLFSEAERETKTRWLSGQLTCSLASFLASRPIDWCGCVRLARDKFERYFNHKARQLLHSFPPETRLADGTPFWQLPKRQPTPVEFCATDPLHQKFLMSYSRLLADQLTITLPADVDFNSPNTEDLAKHLDNCLQAYTPPVFVPSAKRIATDEDETSEVSVNNQNAEASTGGDPLNLDEHTIRALRTTLTALEDAVKLRCELL
ncbi:ubiquitin-activating enzyme E1-like protein 2 [Clonorchis sinensis]|uniref:Ubiquitin-activating enzyme E1-like protein 2 n=1 Tax=Clonorchis sinensis TaxID=79923 RepID=H2KQ28_CLOSI|nr:ubiquitin-activating enzyme E1-like protein 2 [Clonorchis sinensis]